MMRIALSSVAVATVLGGAAFSVDAQARDDFRWTGRIAAGKEIEVVGLAGEIRAVPSSGTTVEVVGEMHGRSVPVRVVEHEGGVTMCVEHPGARAGGWRDDRRSRDGRCQRSGSWGGSVPRVDFTVRVPAGVAFSGGMVSGDVRAEGLRGRVRAASVSGEVDLQTSDVAEASTVSGDMRVVMGRLPQGGALRFSSVSGNVRLGLPADAGAVLRINTVSGEIDSEFPITLGRRGDGRPSWVRARQVEATLGRGGTALEISTVSGDVEIDRNR